MPLSAAVGFLVSDYQKGQGSVSVYNIPSLSPTLFKKTKTIVPLRALKTNWLLQTWGQKYSCVCMCVYVHACGGGQNQKTDSCKKNLHNCNFELDSNALLLFTFQQVVHMAAHQNGLTLAGIESACAPYRMFHGTSRLIQVNINTASTEDFHITTSQFLWDDTFSLSIVFFFVEVGVIHLNSL